jgi:choline dehydrogenase-like flavoprotein
MIPPADESFGIPLCPLTFYQEDFKHWIPLTSLEKMAETEYDVLIVGSGAGGGAVLWRLCEEWGENGKKIGLIESGDLVLPTHAFNLPTLNFFSARQLMQNYYIPIGQELPEFPGAVEKLFFGGGTLIWGAVSPRMKNSEIQSWPISLREMDYYYNAAEWIMNVNRNFGRGSALTEGVLGRLHRNGFTEAEIRPMALDLEPTNYGMLHSNVFFSSINFFAYALNRSPVDVAVKARGIKVHTDGGKVIGVEAVTPTNKKSFVIKAKKVVLSAGTFGPREYCFIRGLKAERSDII